MDDKVYLTSEGFQKIKGELETLRNKTRPNTVERLALARMQGDLSENNEYASARDELAFVDGRIEELEELLQKVILKDGEHQGCETISFGCRVMVRNGKDESVYHIVGEWEADPTQKKVSHFSPLGKALLGRKVGEEVEFEAPAGKILYTIVKID
ncbi:MAG TPA: transcription elongation factor GreA [Patescibacteria group bacterium]|nr:transcription elongation factor GreA [Patescibacteria group bacterium]